MTTNKPAISDLVYPTISFIAVCLLGLFIAAAAGTEWGTTSAGFHSLLTIVAAALAFLFTLSMRNS